MLLLHSLFGSPITFSVEKNIPMQIRLNPAIDVLKSFLGHTIDAGGKPRGEVAQSVALPESPHGNPIEASPFIWGNVSAAPSILLMQW